LLLETFARVFRGLALSIRKIGGVVALLGVIAAVSATIAIPFWYFSSNFARAYTIFVITLLASALLVALSSRLVRLSREPEGIRLYFKQKILPILKTAAVVTASAAVIYAIALIFSRGYTVLAIVAAVLWILLLGFLKYAWRGKR
jgi:hypothetical protein